MLMTQQQALKHVQKVMLSNIDQIRLMLSILEADIGESTVNPAKILSTVRRVYALNVTYMRLHGMSYRDIGKYYNLKAGYVGQLARKGLQISRSGYRELSKGLSACFEGKLVSIPVDPIELTEQLEVIAEFKTAAEYLVAERVKWRKVQPKPAPKKRVRGPNRTKAREWVVGSITSKIYTVD